MSEDLYHGNNLHWCPYSAIAPGNSKCRLVTFYDNKNYVTCNKVM